MNLIWATRGRTWGFRFLLDGGFTDPLPEYEAAFAAAGDGAELCHRAGDRVALRFPDPLDRRDRAGRVIPHDFVIFGPRAAEIDSVAAGIRLVWDRSDISGEYAQVWELSAPPTR